jgi:hypothetical protein
MSKKIWLVLILAVFGVNACTAFSSAEEKTDNELFVITPIPHIPLSPLPDEFPKIDRYPPTGLASFQQETLEIEIGKNPGLGIRSLHAKGITGRGVGIAIIDQTLLVDHQEYVDQLQLYEETEDIKGDWSNAQMHGPAVASLAVGKTVGVAPETDLYYIGSAMCNEPNNQRNYLCYAKGVYRIIEINEQLPEDRKIRALSMSIGFREEDKGYAQIMEAIEEARAAGLFVISANDVSVPGTQFIGLSRDPLGNPDDFPSYGPGPWAEYFYDGNFPAGFLMVPMGNRTAASQGGADRYTYYRDGGISWAIPYIAGMYALVVQVDPSITPDEFWELAMETGEMIELEHEGEMFLLGPILNPSALIEALQSE